MMLAAAVAWIATCRSCPPPRNLAPPEQHWEPCGPKLRCTASTSVPRHTQSLHRSRRSALRPWPCVPYHPHSISLNHSFSLIQCVASADPGANVYQRIVVTWYSCPWKWHRLNTRHKMSKPTHATSHKQQWWTCMPWTESCCQRLNLPRYSLFTLPTLAQPLSYYNAGPCTPSSCFPHSTFRCTHDKSFVVDAPRHDRPPGVQLCVTTGKCSLDLCHARSECCQCKHSCAYACTCSLQSDRASADGTMPKQSEEQRPQDGALPKPPRSRFRADGRRRRTSGELKKRAPYVQYWKDIQAKQRERERERGREGLLLSP